MLYPSQVFQVALIDRRKPTPNWRKGLKILLVGDFVYEGAQTFKVEGMKSWWGGGGGGGDPYGGLFFPGGEGKKKTLPTVSLASIQFYCWVNITHKLATVGHERLKPLI